MPLIRVGSERAASLAGGSPFSYAYDAGARQALVKATVKTMEAGLRMYPAIDCPAMDNPVAKAAEYRKLAAQCLEVAERMSLRADRERMMEMATRWLEMAQKAEAGKEG